MSPNVRSSATATALQIPLMPRSSGRRSTAASWNTSVRRKEIAADISPLFNAVKKRRTVNIKSIDQIGNAVNTETVLGHGKQIRIISDKDGGQRSGDQLRQNKQHESPDSDEPQTFLEQIF